jgi:hypothetical protein
MIEEKISDKEMAFAEELSQYRGKWVAILNYGSDEEVIVGSGDSIIEARRDAQGKGFNDATFFKVPRTDSIFIPLMAA